MISLHTVLTRLFIITFHFPLTTGPAGGAYANFQPLDDGVRCRVGGQMFCQEKGLSSP